MNEMLERFIGYIPPGGLWLCAFLSLAIPMSIYYINQTLHKYGDPPWKKDQQEE